jgi:hypothetical protein
MALTTTTSYTVESQQRQSYVSRVLRILDAVEAILADSDLLLEEEGNHEANQDSIFSLTEDFGLLPSMAGESCTHTPRLKLFIGGGRGSLLHPNKTRGRRNSCEDNPPTSPDKEC